MRRAWLLLVFAAALALWLWRSPREENADVTTSTAEHSTEPGFVATGAVLFDTDALGRPQYRLVANRVEQADPKADIQVSAPKFHYQGAADWILTAQHGTLPPAAHSASLVGDVSITLRRPNVAPLQILTSTLDLDMILERADTSAPVTLNWGSNRISATGLHADMKADSLRLDSQVRGEFKRRR